MDTSVHLPPSPSGCTALLVVIDVFTGFILLRALKNTTAHSVANELWKIFADFGLPKIIQSDNGSEFVNDIIKILVKLTGIDHRFISPYNPRADGKVERSIGTVMSIIKKSLHGTSNNWDMFVSFAQLSFNNKISSLTGSSPFSLMFGRSLNDMVDYTSSDESLIDLENWREHQKKILSLIYPAISERISVKKNAMTKELDKHRRLLANDSIPPGSIVMLIDPVRANKFEPKYIGPFTVTRRSRHGGYVLRDGTGDILDRHVPADQLKLVSRTARTSDKRDDIYEVETILNHRGKKGAHEYYTKWKGYSDDFNTWQKENSFLDDQCIRKYWNSINRRSTRRNK